MDTIELNKRMTKSAAGDRAARDRDVAAAREGDVEARLELVRRLGCCVFTREEISNVECRRLKAEVRKG